MIAEQLRLSCRFESLNLDNLTYTVRWYQNSHVLLQQALDEDVYNLDIEEGFLTQLQLNDEVNSHLYELFL